MKKSLFLLILSGILACGGLRANAPAIETDPADPYKGSVTLSIPATGGTYSDYIGVISPNFVDIQIMLKKHPVWFSMRYLGSGDPTFPHMGAGTGYQIIRVEARRNGNIMSGRIEFSHEVSGFLQFKTLTFSINMDTRQYSDNLW